jgi:hypothetical protein
MLGKLSWSAIPFFPPLPSTPWEWRSRHSGRARNNYEEWVVALSMG